MTENRQIVTSHDDITPRNSSFSKWDVFVSHASEDRENIVAAIVVSLRRSGLSVWYDQIDSHFTHPDQVNREDIRSMLESAMSRSEIGLLVFSEAFFSKPWPQEELRYFLRKLQSKPQEEVVFPVIHDLSHNRVKELLRSAHLPENMNIKQVVRCASGVDVIAKKILSKLKPRSWLSLYEYDGPVNIGIFPSHGHIVLGGLFGESSQLEVIDYTGRRLDHKKFTRSLGALRSEFEIKSDNRSTLTGVMKRFNTDITYAHIHHLHQEIVTEEEVKNGVAINFGTNDQPLVFYPFFTCDAFTGGLITHMPDELTLQCLEIAEGSYKGNWKRISVAGDRFYVQGEE